LKPHHHKELTIKTLTKVDCREDATKHEDEDNKNHSPALKMQVQDKKMLFQRKTNLKKMLIASIMCHTALA